jgi:hypothetical protein
MALQDIVLFDPVVAANIPMSGSAVSDPQNIVLRNPPTSADILLASGLVTTINLWINTSGGSKRAVYAWVNTSSGAKKLTDLSINTSGGRKDIIFS